MGRIVYEQKEDLINETKQEVDLRENGSGIYFVEIKTGEQIARRKIVKQ